MSEYTAEEKQARLSELKEEIREMYARGCTTPDFINVIRMILEEENIDGK